MYFFLSCLLYTSVATIKIAMRTAFHARQQRFLKTEEFKTLAHFRNGIETVPAALRDVYKRQLWDSNLGTVIDCVFYEKISL